MLENVLKVNSRITRVKLSRLCCLTLVVSYSFFGVFILVLALLDYL